MDASQSCLVLHSGCLSTPGIQSTSQAPQAILGSLYNSWLQGCLLCAAPSTLNSNPLPFPAFWAGVFRKRRGRRGQWVGVLVESKQSCIIEIDHMQVWFSLISNACKLAAIWLQSSSYACLFHIFRPNIGEANFTGIPIQGEQSRTS